MSQKIGTSNCQCIPTSTAKQQMLLNNFELYKISTLAAQEKHIKRNTGKTYILYIILYTYLLIPAVKVIRGFTMSVPVLILDGFFNKTEKFRVNQHKQR